MHCYYIYYYCAIFKIILKYKMNENLSDCPNKLAPDIIHYLKMVKHTRVKKKKVGLFLTSNESLIC